MGGEKFALAVDQRFIRGSPPHGRGKGFQNGHAAGKIGITPAWAGKSLPP